MVGHRITHLQSYLTQPFRNNPCALIITVVIIDAVVVVIVVIIVTK